MVVVSLVAIILGISSAFFSNLRRGHRLEASGNQIVSVLRTARQWALAGSARAQVEIDSSRNSFRGVGRRIVGQWHFEDERTSGAYGRHGQVHGVEWISGRFGQGGLFGQSPGSRIDCGLLGEFGLSTGIAMEAWVEPRRPCRQVILRAGRGAVLRMDDEMRLVGQSGGAQVLTEPGFMTGNRFTHVALVADGVELALWIDRVRVASVPMDEMPRLEPERTFTVSDSSLPFHGIIDEVRLDHVVTLEQIELPERIRIVRTPERFVFDARGRLDSGVHGDTDIERVLLYSENLEKWAVVEVTRMGGFKEIKILETQEEAERYGAPPLTRSGS